MLLYDIIKNSEFKVAIDWVSDINTGCQNACKLHFLPRKAQTVLFPKN